MTVSDLPDVELSRQLARFSDPLDLAHAKSMPYERRLDLLQRWLAHSEGKRRRDVINALLVLEGKAELRDDEPDDAPRVRGYGVVDR